MAGKTSSARGSCSCDPRHIIWTDDPKSIARTAALAALYALALVAVPTAMAVAKSMGWW